MDLGGEDGFPSASGAAGDDDIPFDALREWFTGYGGAFLFLKDKSRLNQNSQQSDAAFWRGMSNDTGGSIGH